MVTLGLVGEAFVMAGSVVRNAVEMFGEAAVEAFDHAVGLRPEGPDEAVPDMAAGAQAIDGVVTGGSLGRFVFFVDGEAVGPFAAIIGQDGVDGDREGGEEAFEKGGGGSGVAARVDFEIDKTGGAIDGDKGVAGLAAERCEIFEIDMDEPGRRIGVELLARIGLPGWARRQAMALQAAVDGAARQLGVDAAPQHFGDVIEREHQAAPQLNHQAVFFSRQAGGQAVGPMRAVKHLAAAAPAGDGVVADPELTHQFAWPGQALLDIGADRRRGGGQLMQTHHHAQPPRHAMTNLIPASIPSRSRQSRGTKYESGGPGQPLRRLPGFLPGLDPGITRE